MFTPRSEVIVVGSHHDDDTRTPSSLNYTKEQLKSIFLKTFFTNQHNLYILCRSFWFLLKFYPTSCGDSDWTVWPGSLLTIFIFISIISHFSRQTPQSTDLYSNKQLYIGRKTFIKFRFNNKHQVDSGWMCNFQLYLLVVNTL